MKRKQMISFVLAGTLSASSLSMYAQPVITELPRIEIQDDVQTTTSPAIEIVPEDRPTVLPLLPEDYEQEANKPVTLPMTPEDYEKMESVPLEEPQLEVNEEGYTVIQYNEGTLQETIEKLNIEVPEKLKLEGSQLLTEADIEFLQNATYLDLSAMTTSIENLEDIFSSDLIELSLPKGIKTIKTDAFYYSDLKKLIVNEGVTKIETEAFSAMHDVEMIILPKTVKTIGLDICYGSGTSDFFLGIDPNNNFEFNLNLQKIPFKYVYNIVDIQPISIELPYEVDLSEPIILNARITRDDGKILLFPVEINNEKIDVTKEGIQSFKEKLNFGENIIYKDNGVFTEKDLFIDVSIHIAEKNETKGIIKEIEPIYLETELNKSIQLPYLVNVKLFNNETIKMPVKWDERFLDLRKPGEYLLEGEILLDEKISNPYELKAEITVNVKGEIINPESPIEDFEIDENGRLTKYLGKDSHIVIPEGVTSISSKAFSIFTKQKLESVTFPSTLKKIEQSAFQMATNLKEVVFNEGLEVIDTTAFSMCGKLEKIVLPSTVQSIGRSAFASCALIGVDLGGGVKSIGESAFSLNPNLEFVVGTDSLEVIGKTAFMGCSLLNRMDLENVKEIKKSAFNGTALRKVRFNKLESMEDLAFNNNIYLTEIDFGDSSLEVIPNEAFYNCYELNEILFPKQLKSIGNKAFGVNNVGMRLKNSSDLSLVFPESLTSIADEAFKNNYNITEVYFNNSCELGKKVFSNQFKTLDLKGNLLGVEKEKLPEIIVDTLYISENFDQIDFSISAKNVVVRENVTSINLSALKEAEKITVPSSVQTIQLNSEIFKPILIVEENSYAHQFAKENNLNFYLNNSTENDFIIKDNVLIKYVGDPSKEEIQIPNHVDEIAEKAFKDVNLKKVTLPENLNQVNKDAFDNVMIDELIFTNSENDLILDKNFMTNSQIDKIQLNGDILINKDFDLQNVSIKEIELLTSQEALTGDDYYLKNLNANKLIITSNTLKSIGSNAIVCNFNKVILNEGLESLSNNPFGIDTIVSEIVIPSTLTSLGTIERLESVTFKENSSLKILESNVFKNNNMSLMEIPNSVTTIKNDAFRGGSLPYLIIPESVTTIEPNAFANTSYSFTIITPKGSPAWDFAQRNKLKCIDLNNDSNGDFEIVDNKLLAYKGSEKIVHVPSGVQVIGKNVFANNTIVEEVYLPEETTVIDEKAFYNATNLKKVDGINVNSIYASAFENTVSLEELNSDQIMSIDKKAFYNSNIQSIDLTQASNIDSYAFSKSGIKKVKTGKRLEYLNPFAFREAYDLEIIDLEDSYAITDLNNQVFAFTSSLKEVILPPDLTHLGYNVFLGSGISKIKLPDSFIGFYSEDIVMPENPVDYIPKNPLTYVVDKDHPRLKQLKLLESTGKINLQIENELEVVDMERFGTINVLLNGDIESLNLPKTVKYYLNNDKQIELSIYEWDLSEVDVTKKMSYVIKGKTDIEEAVMHNTDNELIKIIQSNEDLTPVIRINVVTDASNILEMLDDIEFYREVEYNTPFEGLNLPTQSKVLIEGGIEDSLPIIWNKAGYNPKESGEQVFYGSLDLGDNYVNNSDFKLKATIKVNEQPPKPVEPPKPDTSSPDTSKPVEKPLEVIRPAIHKVPLTKLEPAIVSSPLIPLNPSQTAKEELPIITPPQEEKPLEKPIDGPQDEDTNMQQKVDSTNNNVDKNTSNKQPSENDTIKTNTVQEWIEIEPSLPVQTLEDTQSHVEQIEVLQTPISEEVIINENSEQPTNSFYEQVQKLFPNMSYNTFILLSSSIVFIVIALILVIVVYINKKRKEKKMNN